MAKAKRAPNRRPDRKRRDDVIRVRVTSEEKRALVAKATKEGLELSAWTRQQIFRAAGMLD